MGFSSANLANQYFHMGVSLLTGGGSIWPKFTHTWAQKFSKTMIVSNQKAVNLSETLFQHLNSALPQAASVRGATPLTRSQAGTVTPELLRSGLFCLTQQRRFSGLEPVLAESSSPVQHQLSKATQIQTTRLSSQEHDSGGGGLCGTRGEGLGNLPLGFGLGPERRNGAAGWPEGQCERERLNRVKKMQINANAK